MLGKFLAQRNLMARVPVFDLDWECPIPHPSRAGGTVNELGPEGVRAVDGLHSGARIPALRRAENQRARWPARQSEMEYSRNGFEIRRILSPGFSVN